MDAKSLVTLGTITSIVAGAVWLSATLDRKPEATAVTEATAAAIKADIAEFIEFYEEPSERQAVGSEAAVICIASENPLDFAVLEERMAGTFLRLIPFDDCTSKTVEGDFGMFAAITYWYDKSGQEAGMLEIAVIHCPTARRCVVDIETPLRDDRYEVERSGSKWTVTKSEMLRVV